MEEYIVLKPRPDQPVFDVASIRAGLLSHQAVFEDPQPTGYLLVATEPDAREHVIRRRREGHQGHVSAGFVIVRPNHIGLWLLPANRQSLPTMRELAQGLVDRLDPIIESERAGDDWTTRCKGSVDVMLEPELPPGG